MVHEMTAAKVILNNMLQLHPEADEEFLKCFLRPGHKMEDILNFHLYSDTDVADFVHLLSKVCSYGNDAGKSKQLLEKINGNNDGLLFKNILRAINNIIDGNSKVNLCSFILSYFIVLKAMVRLLENGLKILETQLPEIQYLVEKLILLDLEDVGRVAWELQMLDMLLLAKQKKEEQDKYLLAEKETKVYENNLNMVGKCKWGEAFPAKKDKEMFEVSECHSVLKQGKASESVGLDARQKKLPIRDHLNLVESREKVHERVECFSTENEKGDETFSIYRREAISELVGLPSVLKHKEVSEQDTCALVAKQEEVSQSQQGKCILLEKDQAFSEQEVTKERENSGQDNFIRTVEEQKVLEQDTSNSHKKLENVCKLGEICLSENINVPKIEERILVSKQDHVLEQDEHISFEKINVPEEKNRLLVSKQDHGLGEDEHISVEKINVPGDEERLIVSKQDHVLHQDECISFEMINVSEEDELLLVSKQDHVLAQVKHISFKRATAPEENKRLSVSTSEHFREQEEILITKKNEEFKTDELLSDGKAKTASKLESNLLKLNKVEFSEQGEHFTSDTDDDSISSEELTEDEESDANIEEKVTLLPTDSKRIFDSLFQKDTGLESFLGFVAKSYDCKDEILKGILSSIDRYRLRFLIKRALHLILNAISEKNNARLPKLTMDFFITLKATIKSSNRGLKIVESNLFDLHKLLKKLVRVNFEDIEKVLWELEKIERYICDKKKTKIETENQTDPPDDFRKLSVVPMKADVVDNPTPYVRKNIISGPYEDIEHYLDVQFRLMREDMLQSFRKCIANSRYKLTTSDGNFDNGRLFSEVLVEFPPKYTLDGITYNLNVKGPTANLSTAKSLKPGSLICMSSDRFESIIFGTIKDKTIKEETCVQLRIVLEHIGEELSHKVHYALLESDGYFEPYRHVLQRLKEVTEEEYPFLDCIVRLNYEQNNVNHFTNSAFIMPVQPQMPIENTVDRTDEIFDIFDCSQWPPAIELGLDDNQLTALQLALTKKLALVQGPPGTGKTYLSCKIVETLLLNNVSKPIVICCASNQAVDKFLVKLLQYTKKIVRLGGQGKSEILQPHLLSNLIDVLKAEREFGKGIVRELSALERQSRIILESICPVMPRYHQEKALNSDMRYSILSLSDELNALYADYNDCKKNYLEDDILNKFIKPELQKKIIAGSGSNRNVLRNSVIEWLVLYKSCEDVYVQCQKMWKLLTNNVIKSEEKKNEKKDTVEPTNMWRIPVMKRFEIFKEWRRKFLRQLRSRIREKKKRYLIIFRKMKRPVHGDTVHLLKNADIIGMTTCGAAKYHAYITETGPKVMIIEEAAEVFESHIISALAPSIEHLVLIGDHEQLKPLTTTYELSKDYLLDTSMFERLLKNGAPSVRLTRQYRMRSEIATLLVPYFYRTLESDPTVNEYDDVIGVASNLFFMKHKHLEDHKFFTRISSNDFEARFIVKLCEYLLFLGYKQSQITILVAYYGQLTAILKHIEFEIKDLQICTVDSYQGEENDIILITFVRSNIYGDIGFLSQSDRLCVALSRAKKGLYCVGNFDMFASNSSLWSCIVKRLESEGMTGTEFPLRCRNHKDNVVHLRYPEEFEDFMIKGCGAKCGFQLPCDHYCTKQCHFDDPCHTSHQCQSPCERNIDVKGKLLPCRKLCWEICRKKKKSIIALPCGHEIRTKEVDIERINYKCNVEYEMLLSCGHFVIVSCSKSNECPPPCTAEVHVILNCGHIKSVLCNELQDGLPWHSCRELTTRTGPCGHIVLVPCADHNDDYLALSLCSRPCDTLLKCGHPCTGFCKSCFKLHIHEICIYPCSLKLSCGHECKGLCNMPCPPCEQSCKIKCAHSKCPNRCERPCVKCLEKCDRQCQHRMCDKECWELCLPCEKPCEKVLKCGHQCIGICGEPCPAICRICNFTQLDSPSPKSDLFVLLEDCGHVIEVKEMRSCVINAIDGMDWPACPTCYESLTRNVHFDSQLKNAKTIMLKCADPEDELHRIHDFMDTIFPKGFITSSKFCNIHRTIKCILMTEKPTEGFLYVLRHCLLAIQKLKDIEQYITYGRCKLELHFNDILRWIVDHLKEATYEQLEELDAAVLRISKSSRRIC